MAKIEKDYPITDLSEDWVGHSGGQVQEFLKKTIRDVKDNSDEAIRLTEGLKGEDIEENLNINVKPKQYTTTVGNAPVLYNEQMFSLWIKDVDPGAKYIIKGSAGTTRAWVKIKDGIITEIIYNKIAYAEYEVIADGSFDELLLNFRDQNYDIVCVHKGEAGIPAMQKGIKENKEKIDEILSAGEVKSIKILLIGSSFGVNTIVQVPMMLKAAGINYIVGNMYKGSGTLHDIREAIETDSDTAYTARLADNEHNWYIAPSRKIIDVIKMTDWDVIIVQRSAPDKEGGSTYWTTDMAEDLEVILSYIRANTHNKTRVVMNSVFGRPLSRHHNFESQDANALKIMETAYQMREQFGIDVIPAATAIQNARHTSLAFVQTSNSANWDVPDMAGETDHLDIGLGSYVLACCVFDFICSRWGMSCVAMNALPQESDVEGNAISWGLEFFTPVTEEQAKIARYCAATAVRNPLEINKEIGKRYPREDASAI